MSIAIPQRRLWLPSPPLWFAKKRWRNSSNERIRHADGANAGKRMYSDGCCCAACDDFHAIGVNSMVDFPANVTHTRIPRTATVTITDGPAALLSEEFVLTCSAPSVGVGSYGVTFGSRMWFSNNEELRWPGFARGYSYAIFDGTGPALYTSPTVGDYRTEWGMGAETWAHGPMRMNLLIGAMPPVSGSGESQQSSYGASLLWNVVANTINDPFGWQPSGSTFPVDEPDTNDLIYAESLIAEYAMRRLDRTAFCTYLNTVDWTVTDMEEYDEFTIQYTAEDTHEWDVTGSTIDVSSVEFTVVLSNWENHPLASD